MKIPAIYQIQSKIKPNRIYIGSAINVYKRWGEHINRLRANKHGNLKLQRHYNKYGESDLQFSILLNCDKEDLIKNEQYFLDSYKPYFNILKIAGSALGCKHSKESVLKRTGLKRSQEFRDKVSILMLGNKNSLGYKRTEEQKQHLREIHMGKKNHSYGKIVSKETREKCSRASMKRWNKNNANA